MQLSITQLRLDGGTQPRAQLDMLVIAEYAEAMRQGAVFPPVTVFYDGQNYWLADGFHRVRAAEMNGDGDGAAAVEADVRQGALRDAILHSASANAEHGLRRTNADKRRAVTVLLADPDWAQWSDNEVARRCSVSAGLVGQLRSELVPTSSPGAPISINDEQTAQVSASMDDAKMQKPGSYDITDRHAAPSVAGQDLAAARKTGRQADAKRTVKRGGKTYTMKTAQIGKNKKTKSRPAAKISKEANKAQIASKPVIVERIVTAPVVASPKCPACNVEPTGYERQGAAWRCGDCGASVILSVSLADAAACPSCGQPVVKNAAFCGHCGEVIKHG